MAATLLSSRGLSSAYAASTGGLINDIRDFGAVASTTVDNVPAIQAAIDALPSTGGTIFIPEGVFGVEFIGPDAILIPSNVTVLGTGPASILRVMKETVQRTHVLRNQNWDDGNSNCLIQDLTIDCNGFGTYHKEINGVTFKNSSHCLVTRVRVLDGRGYGIWFSDTEHSEVSGCYARNFTDGIELNSNSKFNKVDGNTVESKGPYSWVSAGLIAYGEANYNTFTNNIVTGGFGAGISTVSKYGNGNHNVFSGNIVNVYNAAGVYIAGQGNSYIDNSITATLAWPVIFAETEESESIILNNNQIYGKVGSAKTERPYGLRLSDRARQIIIDSNSFVIDGGVAVYLKGKDISFTNNQVLHTGSIDDNAVAAESVEGLILTTNNISGKASLPETNAVIQGNLIGGVGGETDEESPPTDNSEIIEELNLRLKRCRRKKRKLRRNC